MLMHKYYPDSRIKNKLKIVLWDFLWKIQILEIDNMSSKGKDDEWEH